MRTPARLALPIASALLLTLCILGGLWWELKKSTASLLQYEQHLPQEEPILHDPLLSPEPKNTDPRTQALLSLRQGDLFAVQGEWASAESEYISSVKEGGGLPALRKLAQAQLQRRNLRGVRQTIDQLRQKNVRSEDLMLLEGIVLLRTGELQKLAERLEGTSDSPQGHYLQALLAIIQENHEKAKTELSALATGWEPTLRSSAKALQAAYEEYALFPESPSHHLLTLLTRALAQVQECEIALPLLASVTQKQDDYRDAWIVQGYCELTTERPEQALISLERAYALDPEKPEIQYFLARTYATLGNHRSALTFFQYSLRNGFTPQHEIHRRIAREADAIGETSLALEQYGALINLPEARRDDLEDAVQLAIREQKREEGYALATKGAERWPNDARTLYLLGWTASETGRNDEANRALEQALNINPTFTAALELQKKIR